MTEIRKPDLHTEASKGARAEQLLKNPVYVEAVDTIRRRIYEQWESAPIRDREGQHELKLMLKLLGDLEANIKQVAETGRLAQIDIERENRFALFRKR